MLDYRQVHIQVLSPLLEQYPEVRLGYVFGSYLCREKYRDVDIDDTFGFVPAEAGSLPSAA